MTPELLETLLAPITPEHPGGTDVVHSSACDEIRKLRKGDDPSLPQGDWSRELRAAQWPKVRELCETLLTTQSKDLQVACWYSEALTHLEGLPGLTFSLKLLEELLERFWESLFPSLDPADLDERVAKFEWLNSQLTHVINQVPMTNPKNGGYSRLKWEESRMVENLGARDPAAKEEAIAEGKLTAEAFDKAVSASGRHFYLNLHEQIRNAREGFEQLEATVDKRFGKQAPGLESMREAIKDCFELTTQTMKRFGFSTRIDTSTPAGDPTPRPSNPMNMKSESPSQHPNATSGPIQSRRDAIQRLREIAKYYQEHEPHSPVGPLVERAARWGEMPLDEWLTRVIKDEATLGHLRELLDLQPEV